MCQYDPDCPVTRHRPGTVCPEVLRKRKAADKAELKRFQNIVSVVMSLAVLVATIVIVSMMIPGGWSGFFNMLKLA